MKLMRLRRGWLNSLAQRLLRLAAQRPSSPAGTGLARPASTTESVASPATRLFVPRQRGRAQRLVARPGGLANERRPGQRPRTPPPLPARTQRASTAGPHSPTQPERPVTIAAETRPARPCNGLAHPPHGSGKAGLHHRQRCFPSQPAYARPDSTVGCSGLLHGLAGWRTNAGQANGPAFPPTAGPDPTLIHRRPALPHEASRTPHHRCGTPSSQAV